MWTQNNLFFRKRLLQTFAHFFDVISMIILCLSIKYNVKLQHEIIRKTYLKYEKLHKARSVADNRGGVQ